MKWFITKDSSGKFSIVKVSLASAADYKKLYGSQVVAEACGLAEALALFARLEK